MPKNTTGGSHHKRQGHQRQIKPEFEDPENGLLYGIVTNDLGDCRFAVMCTDGKNRVCHLRGSLKKKIKIRKQNTVLVSRRMDLLSENNTTDNKADIVYQYSPEQIRDYGIVVKDAPKDTAEIVFGETEDNTFDFDEI